MSSWFDDASIEALQGDVPRAVVDDELSEELRKEKVRQHKQANDLRGWFFALASALACATVATSAALVLAVTFGKSIETPIAVAFIAGLAIETVGVLAIMAGYLFPKEATAD